MIRPQHVHFTCVSRKVSGGPLVNKVLLVLGLFTIWLALPCAHAGFYKWVDDTGRIHYSEIPPQSSDFQVIAHRSSSKKANQPVPAKTLPSKSLGQKDQKLNKSHKELQTTANNELIRKKNCKAATQNLNTLQSSGRIKLLDGDEYRFLSPEEKAAKIAQAKTQITQNCD